jgi:hypothetical protein
MKIEHRVVILSEENKEITDPHKGFIVVGNVMAAIVGDKNQPSDGLIGPNFDADGKVSRWMAFTKEEMLRVLGYTIDELDEIIAQWKDRAEKERLF